MLRNIFITLFILFLATTAFADVTNSRSVPEDTTSYIAEIFVENSASSSQAGLTGLVHNSAGLDCYYHRDSAATATQITLSDGTVGTYSSGGFKEIDSTNMPGWYQLGIPNAALATGAKNVALVCKGATNMVPINTTFLLEDVGTLVWATATRTLTANTNLNDPTAASIADAVWEELIADHSGTSGSTAESLDSAGSGADASAIADAVWDEILSGHATAGSAGALLDASVNDTLTCEVTN